jgi:hypothetical protein
MKFENFRSCTGSWIGVLPSKRERRPATATMTRRRPLLQELEGVGGSDTDAGNGGGTPCPGGGGAGNGGRSPCPGGGGAGNGGRSPCLGGDATGNGGRMARPRRRGLGGGMPHRRQRRAGMRWRWRGNWRRMTGCPVGILGGDGEALEAHCREDPKRRCGNGERRGTGG